MNPKQLEREGWTRRSVASEPRLSEAVALYESLGLEVFLAPALSECAAEGGETTCTTCFSADENPDRHKIIYTRPKAGAKGDDGLPAS